MASERERVLRVRYLQFAILLAVVIGGVFFLATSPSVTAGVPAPAIAALGMILVLVVAVKMANTLYKELPSEREEKDLISEVAEAGASARVVGKMAEIKYGRVPKRVRRGERIEEYYPPVR